MIYMENNAYKKMQQALEEMKGKLDDSMYEKTTNCVKNHTLKIDKLSFRGMKKVYDDLSDLTQADLIDLKNGEEYGKFN